MLIKFVWEPNTTLRWNTTNGYIIVNLYFFPEFTELYRELSNQLFAQSEAHNI